MNKQVHILNGDALKEQLPNEIEGEVIVARECLVDGDVTGAALDDLFATRAVYLSTNYGCAKSDYYTKSASEILKLLEIDKSSELNLWFEDDLFCQVNFWFVVHVITSQTENVSVFLLRPVNHTHYGFGGLNSTELMSIYENRIQLEELNLISQLWPSYQVGDTDNLMNTAALLADKYPFILQAAKAHIDRLPIDGLAGRPAQSLMRIMKEMRTDNFGAMFQEFSRRESIYGYGDVQVKSLYDKILSSKDSTND